MTIRNLPQSENCVCESSNSLPAARMPFSPEHFAVLGHEIRNPLSALDYALQAWPSSKDDPQLSEQLFQIMRRQVAQLTRLCNDLLDTERIARGSLSIASDPVDLRQVIQNALEQIQPLVEQCGHKLKVEVGNLPARMLGDESRLTQVFANLIHNSTKFTEPNGHLHLSLEIAHDEAIIRLRDSGRGMCSERLRSLFVAGNGPKSCTEAVGEGLGIGLRLAKSIVELHHGSLEAFSEGLGRGSTFVIRLPMLVDSVSCTPAAPSTLVAAEQKHETHRHPFRIMVVDDDRSLRFLMPRLLMQMGHSVTVADGGENALLLILQGRPDIVFLDLHMRGMSGYEVAKRIRSSAELKTVVLIALSGNSDAESRAIATESGFDQYLTKPTSFHALRQAISQVGPRSVRSGAVPTSDTSTYLAGGCVHSECHKGRFKDSLEPFQRDGHRPFEPRRAQLQENIERSPPSDRIV